MTPQALSGPWLAQHFHAAYQLLAELNAAASNDEFTLESLSPGELNQYSSRLSDASHLLPSRGELSIGETDPRPLEIQALDLALRMIGACLDAEEYRRRCDPEHAEACREFWEARGIEQ